MAGSVGVGRRKDSQAIHERTRRVRPARAVIAGVEVLVITPVRCRLRQMTISSVEPFVQIELRSGATPDDMKPGRFVVLSKVFDRLLRFPRADDGRPWLARPFVVTRVIQRAAEQCVEIVLDEVRNLQHMRKIASEVLVK